MIDPPCGTVISIRIWEGVAHPLRYLTIHSTTNITTYLNNAQENEGLMEEANR
jgi:CelD/BcsL family acetyltransferase involved in cellulose biosynthesis